MEHDEQNKRKRMPSTWLQQEGSKARHWRGWEKVTKLVMEGETLEVGYGRYGNVRSE